MIKVSIIVNDEALSGFKAEHGLALWVEVVRTDGSSFRLLADTGQHAKTLLVNAERLHIDLSSADAVLLSHGHYDHSGGLPALASLGYEGPVISSPDCTRRRFSVSLSKSVVSGVAAPAMRKENGLPCLSAFEALRHIWVSSPAEVFPGLTVFPLPDPAPANIRLVDETGAPDSFPDELFTVVSDGNSRLLLGGCTHHGLLQLFSNVSRILGLNEVDAFVGGLHLVGHPASEIQSSLEAAKLLGINQWLIGHCTGSEAVAAWQNAFPDVHPMLAGFTFSLGE